MEAGSSSSRQWHRESDIEEGGGEILRQVRDRKRKVWKITTDPGKAKDTGREKKKKKRFGKKIHTELERDGVCCYLNSDLQKFGLSGFL